MAEPPAVDEARLQRLIEAMSLDEKVAMAAGASLWYSTPVPRLGIPAFKMSDGPTGVRGDGATRGVTSTCFPVGTALAASWDTELLAEVGRALGREARAKGVDVLLGPTINLHRTPLAGRNFECYSEDPTLTADLAVAYTRAVQEARVAVCLKHFVCNDSEFERHSISSDVAAGPLRELYLRPFQRAIEEADAWSLMSAYNRLNGEYCSGHQGLLGDLLKGDWGFDGLVISDWNGTYDTVAPARAGLDLEMPGPARRMGEKLAAAVAAGEVEVAMLDDKVRRQLRLMARTGRLDAPDIGPEQSPQDGAHVALARRAAAAGMVLLHNEGLLPVAAAERIALIGPNAVEPQIQGGGSSRVQPGAVQDLPTALRERFGSATRIDVAQGTPAHRYLPTLDPRWLRPEPDSDGAGLRVDFFAGPELAGDVLLTTRPRRTELLWFGRFAEAVPDDFSVRVSAQLTPREAGRHAFSLVSAGLARLYVDDVLVVDNWDAWQPGDAYFGNGSAEARGHVELRAGVPVRLRVEYSRGTGPMLAGLRIGMLPPQSPTLMDDAVALAAAADLAIVVAGLNSDWETEGSDRRDMQLPGDQGELIRRVAAANPRTLVVLNAGAPIDVGGWLDRVPALLQVWYPGEAFAPALVDVISGVQEPGGRLPMTVPVRCEDVPAMAHYPGSAGHVRYDEGLLVGYRGFDALDRAPRFAFGFGLGYTDFELVDGEAWYADDALHCRVAVRNIGDRAGTVVVQAYLEAAQRPADRPPRELCGHARLHLEAAAEGTLHITRPLAQLDIWEQGEASSGWRRRSGPHRVHLGLSSRDLRLALPLTLPSLQ